MALPLADTIQTTSTTTVPLLSGQHPLVRSPDNATKPTFVHATAVGLEVEVRLDHLHPSTRTKNPKHVSHISWPAICVYRAGHCSTVNQVKIVSRKRGPICRSGTDIRHQEQVLRSVEVIQLKKEIGRDLLGEIWIDVNRDNL